MENPIKPPFSHGFPMVFLWFTHGLPMATKALRLLLASPAPATQRRGGAMASARSQDHSCRAPKSRPGPWV